MKIFKILSFCFFVTAFVPAMAQDKPPEASNRLISETATELDTSTPDVTNVIQLQEDDKKIAIHKYRSEHNPGVDVSLHKALRECRESIGDKDNPPDKDQIDLCMIDKGFKKWFLINKII